MGFDPGDILHIDAPIADHGKFHICLGTNEFSVTLCVFLNSEPGYRDEVVFDCDRLPMLPASDTGKSVVSLSLLPRYNERQLGLFRASKKGELPKDVAAEILAVVPAVKSLTKPERDFVIASLTAYIAS